MCPIVFGVARPWGLGGWGRAGGAGAGAGSSWAGAGTLQPPWMWNWSPATARTADGAPAGEWGRGSSPWARPRGALRGPGLSHGEQFPLGTTGHSRGAVPELAAALVLAWGQAWQGTGTPGHARAHPHLLLPSPRPLTREQLFTALPAPQFTASLSTCQRLQWLSPSPLPDDSLRPRGAHRKDQRVLRGLEHFCYGKGWDSWDHSA